jgi:hypothetical protein
MQRSTTTLDLERTARSAVALVAGAACALALALAPGASGATSDRPSEGKFRGTHAFDGPISLTFAREDGIGLYLHRYSVRGTLRCADEEIAIDIGGPVTARTAARVRRGGRFRLISGTVEIVGRYDASRRVSGDIKIKTLACTKEGGFRAVRRR